MLGHWVWRWPVPVLVLIAIVIGGMEVVFLAANLTKIASGGWVPLLIAAAVLFVMTTWRRGYAETTQLRIDREGSVADFIRAVNDNPVRRTPGVAVFPHHDSPTVPLALRANVEFNRVLHKQVVIVSLADVNIPHVPDSSE